MLLNEASKTETGPSGDAGLAEPTRAGIAGKYERIARFAPSRNGSAS